MLRSLQIPQIAVMALLALANTFALASPFHGTVTFGAKPLPGAQVKVSQGAKSVEVVSDAVGSFLFTGLDDGKWTIDIQMQCFETIHADVNIVQNMPPAQWEMKLLAAGQLATLAKAGERINGIAPVAVSETSTTESGTKTTETSTQDSTLHRHHRADQNDAQEPPNPSSEQNEQGADGLLVQGSVNNADSSIYATAPAFGNTRAGGSSLYTGGFRATFDNSALDARPYSLSGVNAEKPEFSDFTGEAALQGPLRIPHLLPRGPNFYISYKWARSLSAQILAGLMPTVSERRGDLDGLTNAQGLPVTIYNPKNGVPYVKNQVPVSAQAEALLGLIPQSNISGSSDYNYQTPALNHTHQDEMQLRLDKYIKNAGSFSGGFSLQDVRSDSANLFRFTDRTSALGTNSNVAWNDYYRKLGTSLSVRYEFSRLRTALTPYFEDRTDVSGLAGITGNDRTPANWGPPALNFSSGFSGLSDGISANNRNRTDFVTIEVSQWHRSHSVKMGAEIKRLEWNEYSQANPRGTFTFTGAATQGATSSATSGSDLADFLIGIPDASSIAYGNADKYLRQTEYALYANDDWRLQPNLSFNLGVRWEYSAPLTELFGRLVNLDVISGFGAVAPVLGSDPVGSLTGTHYPSSLLRPDRGMVEPRIGISWRPKLGSTLVIRSGYGIYANTSVYPNIVQQMIQQSPLSKSLSVENNTACPLTLANGFSSCTATTAGTFGVDPDFRLGSTQQWKLEAQYDLPLSMQMTATYLGIKGTHGTQEILPNSYPLGAANPCPDCPSGFVYETSGANSIRHAGQLQLRRRLRSGLAASATYTYAKSIDDAAFLGGQNSSAISIAQNWRNPRADRSLSSFDQRHQLKMQAQYSSGQGLGGGTLLGGWRGRLLKEWTIYSSLNIGGGLPETPIYPAVVPGTGFANILRPRLTGASINSSGGTAHWNVAAFTAPATGQWGDAARNSLTGPGQFSLDSTLARTFRAYKKTSLDLKVVSTNMLNHVAFTSWNDYVTSTQFGLPVSANAMRSMQIQLYLRFQ